MSTGPSYLPVSAFDIDTFNDILVEEIDSDFTSSICCCVDCYEDFALTCPGVEIHDVEFQTNAVSVYYCVEQSHLVHLYTAELMTLKHFVFCPRCGTYVRRSIHIFEHPFDRVEEIEKSIGEPPSIGSATPFLLLKHPFARSILEAVRGLSADTTPKLTPGTFFRARKSAHITKQYQSFSDIATFGPSPSGVIGEGRFNHAGAPMICLATTLETALLEIGSLNELSSVVKLALQPLVDAGQPLGGQPGLQGHPEAQ
ncbi:MAG: hypothetical protein ACT6T3_21935, partial [Agrobacterium sp.]|uniref:hypothetical protein n=1 Tax=Agrobacterium sp. TaxID=361 RepID=UPI004033ED50